MVSASKQIASAPLICSTEGWVLAQAQDLSVLTAAPLDPLSFWSERMSQASPLGGNGFL